MSQQSDNIVELYDHEIKTIRDLTYNIMKKYEKKMINVDLMNEMQKEIVGRFQDAGFHVQVDFLDWLFDEEPAPTITVLSRVETLKEFDYDKKRAEVLKARENGEA